MRNYRIVIRYSPHTLTTATETREVRVQARNREAALILVGRNLERNMVPVVPESIQVISVGWQPVP